MALSHKHTEVIETLRGWVAQRPGLAFCYYGCESSYRQESRRITKQRDVALELLQHCEAHPDSIDHIENELVNGTDRLKGYWSTDKNGIDRLSLDYCTGQYWPTEYRAAAARVAARGLWYFLRDQGYTRDELDTWGHTHLSRAAQAYWG